MLLLEIIVLWVLLAPPWLLVNSCSFTPLFFAILFKRGGDESVLSAYLVLGAGFHLSFAFNHVVLAEFLLMHPFHR